MEGKADFHGRATTAEEYQTVAEESGDDPALWDLERYRQLIESPPARSFPSPPRVYPKILTGTPHTYAVGERSDNRSAFGRALADVAKKSVQGGFSPIAAFDCDLEGSVKTTAFHREFPDHFFEAGIQEHHTATCAGALSIEGIATIFADFGVFGVCETYNQHRLTDINYGNLKLVCTHVGLDVGEDGRTHQCIDYVGLLQNLFGITIIVPADPNQTDRALRYLMAQAGMFFLGMGRSKLDIIADEQGNPVFGGDYRFEPGRGDWIRKGGDGLVVAMGTLTGRALQAVDALRQRGIALALAHLATPTQVKDEFLAEIRRHRYLVTVEDHHVRTGLGASLAVHLFRSGAVLPHLPLGVEGYCPSGSAEAVYASQGLDAAGLERRIESFARSFETAS